MAERKKRIGKTVYGDPRYYKAVDDTTNSDRTYFGTFDSAIGTVQGPIAKDHFNGGEHNGVKWIGKERCKNVPKDGIWWQKWRCPWHTSSIPCWMELRVCKDTNKETDPFFIAFPGEDSGKEHNEHDGEHKTGLSKAQKCQVVDTPGKLKKKPAALTNQAMKADGTLFNGSTAEKNSLKSFQICQRKKQQCAHLEEGVDPRSFGATVQTLDLFKLVVVGAAGANFMKHTAFLCEHEEKPYIAEGDPEDETNRRIVAVISTENLLLNAYRSAVQGSGSPSIHIDASHRYHTSDWLFYMPVSVTSLNQQCHVVGYALTSSEDDTAQQFIFDCIKRHVERVVKDKIQNPTISHV